jgi:molybdopterin molybdotransferase
MEIEVQLTHELIAEKIPPPNSIGAHGAWLEFRGVVRAEENGRAISALEYEAYPEMAEREIRRILKSLSVRHPCLAAKIVHRVGVIPVGETAIYAGIASSHRGEAIALLAEFMNLLKQDVPIWKVRALPPSSITQPESSGTEKRQPSQAAEKLKSGALSFDEAFAKIRSASQPLPALRAPLAEAFGRVLRETVRAVEDFPAYDRSTRDGYAILQNDSSETFQIVDTLHAADWKPRQLKTGEAVRVATGSALPCEKLRVVMQENVERIGDTIKIIRLENAANVRRRGEEMRAGQTVLQPGTVLNAGTLALLATVGCAQPLVSPRLRIVHFTTGDEVVPPDQVPRPGEIRDSNSILVRGLLQKFPCDIIQNHLREDFSSAKSRAEMLKAEIESADVLLISGGASVGEKDFTRDLLAHLGFQIVFDRLNIRPGAPLIFGVNGPRVAFGLPGNPVSHFVCFHLFVAAALRGLVGAESENFLRGPLASGLEDQPNPRETFTPARLDPAGLHPLKWTSSGDVTCLVETNALIRVPANCGSIEAGDEVEFLPT